MKIIYKKNFFSVVCVIFTILLMVKILLEYVAQGIFGNYQENILTMFFLSLAATFILSQHYRLQKYPLLVVIVGQYVLLIGIVMLITWLSGRIQPVHENGYRDMFLSFTVPYVIGVVLYYGAVFHEIRRADEALQKLKEDRMEQEKGREKE